MDLSYHQLDPIIHQPARLSIMAALAVTYEIEFSVIRDTIVISDSLLSRYISVLEESNYIEVRKVFVNKRAKTWISLTKEGRIAFDKYIQSLQNIVRQKYNISK